jgi:outer membrane immunogenic protein
LLGKIGGRDFVDFLEALLQSENDVNGAIYGAHIGYNIQRNNWVYGVEFGINGTGMDGSGTCVVIGYCSRSMDWYATGVGRLGNASGNTMFYGFGGVAWGDVETEIGIASPGLPFLKGEETHVGWTAGVGIEHALTDRFIVGIEYSHVDLGEENTALSFDGETIKGISSDVDLEFDAIKVRGSYKLTGGREPLESYK